VINGVPHGKEKGVTVCQLHMRSFSNGETITIEPFRAKSFTVIKDLVVDRSSFDRILQQGGYISAKTGTTIDANSILIQKQDSEEAFNAAACIGCGACVAACKNSSAMLFVAAKISHLSIMPQGKIERETRVRQLIQTMDQEGFGSCTNTLECEAVCPKEISTNFISRLNLEYIKSI
jgi:succinate dehydrogenase / fumarate reductase iron-sulfur subunit